MYIIFYLHLINLFHLIIFPFCTSWNIAQSFTVRYENDYPSKQARLDAGGLYLRFLELVKIWSDVEQNAIFSPWESDASEKQDEEHEVWISSREINHL